MGVISEGLQRPLFLADHLVLDFLNTVVSVHGEVVDLLQSDEDVKQWLGQVESFETLPIARGPGLLRAARLLRESVRAAIERRKAGKQPDLKVLNNFLARSRSHLEVLTGRGGTLRMERRWKPKTEGLLGPLAEAAAELLTAGDFELIRQCEDASCVLWFYDRTKSHHRRWCSAATCGNRNKVAAFRLRQQG